MFMRSTSEPGTLPRDSVCSASFGARPFAHRRRWSKDHRTRKPGSYWEHSMRRTPPPNRQFQPTDSGVSAARRMCSISLCTCSALHAAARRG
jgi:hypothetical protein